MRVGVRRCAVVCCPHCGRLQASFTRYKTHTCSHCGRRFNVRKVRWLRSGLTPREAREYIRRLGERRVRVLRFMKRASSLSAAHEITLMRAFVLVNVRTGRELEEFEKAICAIHGVKRAESVAGPYDIVVEVEGPDMATIGKIVSGIRLIDGVTKTLTLISTKGI